MKNKQKQSKKRTKTSLSFRSFKTRKKNKQENKQEETKLVEALFLKEMRTNEIKNEIDENKKNGKK